MAGLQQTAEHGTSAARPPPLPPPPGGSGGGAPGPNPPRDTTGTAHASHCSNCFVSLSVVLLLNYLKVRRKTLQRSVIERSSCSCASLKKHHHGRLYHGAVFFYSDQRYGNV